MFRLKIMFVHYLILLGWLNGEGRWGQGMCNSQRSYKLIYNVIKLQGDSYKNKWEDGIKMYGVDTMCEEVHNSDNSG